MPLTHPNQKALVFCMEGKRFFFSKICTEVRVFVPMQKLQSVLQ